MARTKKQTLPTKMTMNLVIQEKSLASPSRLIPVLLLLAVLVLALSKFGVADRLLRVDAARQRVENVHVQIQQLQDAMEDYDSVQERYSQYSYGSFDQHELALADRLDVLELVKTDVKPYAAIRYLEIRNNILSLTLEGVDLEQASGLVSRLKDSELVSDVSLYTAGYGLGASAGGTQVITMTVTLADAAKGG